MVAETNAAYLASVEKVEQCTAQLQSALKEMATARDAAQAAVQSSSDGVQSLITRTVADSLAPKS